MRLLVVAVAGVATDETLPYSGAVWQWVPAELELELAGGLGVSLSWGVTTCGPLKSEAEEVSMVSGKSVPSMEI